MLALQRASDLVIRVATINERRDPSKQQTSKHELVALREDEETLGREWFDDEVTLEVKRSAH